MLLNFESFNFVLFRSKAQVWSQHQCISDPPIAIDGQKMRVRLASDLMEMEWEILFPGVPETRLPLATTTATAEKPRRSNLTAVPEHFLTPPQIPDKRAYVEANDAFQDRISAMLEAVIIPDQQFNKISSMIMTKKSLIPTPREVQDQPHRLIVLGSQFGMGFAEDTMFAET